MATITAITWKRAAIVLSLLALAFAGVVLWTFPKYTIDDAYITFRYAQNLAEHGELTYNVGERPVEGYTGFAYPLFLSAVFLLGGSPIVATHLLGIFAFLLGVWLIYRLGLELQFQPIVTALIIVLYLSNPINYTHLFSGLETMLFSTSILMSLYLFVRLLSPERKDRSYVPFLTSLLLLSLVRPEGVVLMGLCWLGLLFHLIVIRKHSPRRYLLLSLLYLALPLAAYVAWKYQYYGDLLPNSYYVKLSRGPADLEQNIFTIRKMWRYFVSNPAIAAGLASVAYLVCRRMAGGWAGWNRRFEIRDLMLALVVIPFLVIVLWKYMHSALLMNYWYRFYAPYYASVLILFAVLQARFRTPLPARWRRKWIPSALLLLASVAILLQLVSNIRGLDTQYKFSESYKRLMQQEHSAVGMYLEDILNPHERLIVCIDAGATPFYSKRPAVDFGGLNDLKLARELSTDREKIDYFYSLDAAAVVVKSQPSDGLPSNLLVRAVVADNRFDRYTFHSSYSCDACGEYNDYMLYLYLDEPVIARLAADQASPE